MKRFLLGLIVASVASIGLGGITAFAGSSTPFTASYSSTGTDHWNCSGYHDVHHSGITDSETCFVTGNTSGYVAGTYSSGTVCPAGYGAATGTTDCGYIPPLGLVYWLSDYNGHLATSWTMVVTGETNGTFRIDVDSAYSS
ncbi:MAG TPA: hypothetical protein VJT78_05095 [Candidatus Dormibacteraeota bacterium]|nr:hypothetical protein [Candidatus Dormibacteraeota bacterium]